MLKLFKRIGLVGWRRWLIFALIAFPIFSVVSVEVTSQSWFCNSCHIMNPYYASWKVGSHKGVECIKCHISPGVTNFVGAKLNGLGQVVDDVLYRTSPKPSASVSEFSCTRSGCHSMEKVRATKKDGVFRFVHDKHLDLNYQGITLGCGSCHSHVKGDKHFEVNTGVCITCHMLESEHAGAGAGAGGGGGGGGDGTGGESGSAKAAVTALRMMVRETRATAASDAPAAVATGVGSGAVPALSAGTKVPPANCTACHTPPSKVLTVGGLKVDHAQYLSYGAACESCHRGNTATPAPIQDDRCLQCHTFGVDHTKGTQEMHKIHNEGHHKIECFSCHGDIKHGPAAQTATLEVFDCRRCHKDQHAVQRKTYLSNGAASPHEVGNGAAGAVSPMFMAHVDCTGCHVKPRSLRAKPDSGATVTAAAVEACDNCHKPGLGARLVPLWQKTTHTLFDLVQADLAKAESAGVPGDVIDDTRRLLDMVRVDGSWGVHNPKYTQKILEQARERLRGRGPAPEGEPVPAGDDRKKGGDS